MAYTYTFKQLFDKLDWFLQQKKEGADTASKDKFRLLPYSEAKWFVSDLMRELVASAPDRYEETVTVKFYDSSDFQSEIPLDTKQTIYLDLNNPEEVDGKYLYLPQFIRSLESVYDEKQKVWYIPYDTEQEPNRYYSDRANTLVGLSDFNLTDEIKIKIVRYPKRIKNNIDETTITIMSGDYYGYMSNSFILNNASLERGDEIMLDNHKCKVLKYSDNIVYVDENFLPQDYPFSFNTDNQIVEIDDAYLRYFMLEVKRAVYARKGKALSQWEWRELVELAGKWKQSSSRLRQRTRFSISGVGYGKR
jgi:hypothetical protein